MRKFLISTLLTTLVISTNGRIINYENVSNHTISNILMPIRNPHSKFLTSITYGDIEVSPRVSGKEQTMDGEKSCWSEQQQYSECVRDRKTFDAESCKAVLDGKCKAFFNDPFSVMPTCKEAFQDFPIFIPGIKYVYNYFKLACTKEGKCPLYEDYKLFEPNQYGSNSNAKNNKGYTPSDSAVTKNCKIAECSEVGFDFIDGLAKLLDYSIKDLNDILAEVEGDEEFKKEDYEEAIKESEEQKKSLNESLEKMKKCKSTSGALSMNKTISNGLMNSLVMSIIFYLYMKN